MASLADVRMTDIKVDIRVPVGAPVPETAAFIQSCEEAGFDGVGVIDHQHTGRDVFVTLAAAATRTSRVTLYPAVTNPVTRHPMVMASVAQSLEEIAPGRVILPIGTGFVSVRNLNRRPATVSQMREYVVALRRLLAGESVYPGMTDGKMVRTTDPPTPVYVTATGPRMIELAGEVADGALLMVGLHPRIMERVREHLERGARRAGRDASDISIILVSGGHFAEDVESARERARPYYFATASNPMRAQWLREAGIAVPDIGSPEEIPGDALEEISEATGIFGPPDYWVERLRRIKSELGVSRIFVQPTATYDMPQETVQLFREHVAPRLARLP